MNLNLELNSYFDTYILLKMDGGGGELGPQYVLTISFESFTTLL